MGGFTVLVFKILGLVSPSISEPESVDEISLEYPSQTGTSLARQSGEPSSCDIISQGSAMAQLSPLLIQGMRLCTRFAAAGRVTIAVAAVASDFPFPAQPDGKKSVLVSDLTTCIALAQEKCVCTCVCCEVWTRNIAF